MKWLLILSYLSHSAFATIVQIKSGQVSGVGQTSFSGKDYLAFLGIPFAENPTGELRFKPPVPKKPWEGVKNGSLEGPPCLQVAQFNEPEVIGSEDCLWLNVYTPKVAQNGESLRPVLVWIYGGRFLIGSASQNVYSPAYMLDHDLVMVSIQYRVGPYGFLSTGDSSAPGNYGMHDQVLALKWIQENIAAFGGDPGQVTVSGHSAGSASAHLHLLSPLSRGLLHRAISLSGTGANFWATKSQDHAKYAKKLGSIFNCDEHHLIECLRKVDPVELTGAQWKLHDFFHKSPAKLPLSTFLPRTDPEAEEPFMPVNSLDVLTNGDFYDLPWMVGITSQEGAWYTSSLYGQDSMEFLQEYDRNPIEATRSFAAGMLTKDADLAEAFHFYSGGKPVAHQRQRIALTEMASDMIFNAETLLAVHLQCRSSLAPVYFYQFNYRGTWSFAHEFEETKHDYEGVAHLDDISYYMKIGYHSELNEEEVIVMKHFTSFIADFVIYGQPTHGTKEKAYVQHWPAFTEGNGVSMIIDNPPRLSRDMPFEYGFERRGRISLWMKLLGHQVDLKEDYTPDIHDEL